MGDRVWYIARPGPTPDDAEARIAGLINAMKEAGVIAGEDTPHAILGPPEGPVYRPGPKAEDGLPGDAGRFSELDGCAVEFIAKPIFNWDVLEASRFHAPCCAAVVPAAEIGEALFVAGDQLDFSDTAVTCPKCAAPSGVNGWIRGGFLLAGCGIGLWNWQMSSDVLNPIRKLAREAFGPELLECGLKI